MAENLRPCIYHPIKHDSCPIFRLDYIIHEAEKNHTEHDIMIRKGGVIRAKLDWDCNLDRSIKLCRPIYSFARLDTPSYEETFSIGFNFRFASYWKRNRKYVRSLTKAYGLRLIISVSGKAGKFDFITLTLNTGSLIGIFGLATFVCDLILLNLTHKASVYRDMIFQRVHLDDKRRKSDAQNRKSLNELMPSVYENQNTNSRQSIPTMWKPGSIARISDTTDTPFSFPPIDQNELSGLQPRIGLTNTLN
jgi:hypothetical protein